MKEVLIGTDRLPPRRVTAKGGAVMGFAVGVMVAGAIGALMLDRQSTAATLSEAKTRATLEGTITAMRTESQRQELSHSGLPLVYLASVGEANLAKVRVALDQFPPFKTDPYKQLFTDLSTVVEREQNRARELKRAVAAQASNGGSLCKVANGPPQHGAIWMQDTVSLSSDGWRGVAP